ncbi:uncharacterized protein LOC110183989 isoform X1 [Drosophila serrata]|uniref:uncharacterized protein LOC110183989 isoform X1 n=1 Tax=Drosophila serrata TaxID=7274 RepID=UPI000A1CF82D|nr:uncharacterized protein LOC110183989 isoform X1 [Drosophila serrata]
MNMELRAESFKRLVNLLKDAGVYEEGMDEEEMLQLVDVMQMSMIDSCQMPESELEFLSLQPNNLHSSTLIVAPPVPASNVFDAWGSPPTEPIYLTVQALVHHAMDWSPSKREGLSRSRKRSSTDNNPPLSEPSAKRSMPLMSERQGAQGITS